ncbi:MAG: hypothetical protein IJU94_00430 [Clostridia bacterium]|nr:hypothetical protein [Clostridia bacterium]
MNKWVIIAIICVVALVLYLIGSAPANHNDGKCDICGKKAVYSDGREEYCSKHLESAVQYYLDKNGY